MYSCAAHSTVEDKMKKILMTCIVVMALALVSIVPRAGADTITYTLNNGNLPNGIGQLPGPYAEASLTYVDATHATITFTALSSGGYTYFLGDGGSVAVNTNGTASLVLPPVTATGAPNNGSVGTYTDGGSGNEDGWGSFSDTINTSGGFSTSATTVTFNIVGSGTNWLSADDVLVGNLQGYEVAAHIFSATGCSEDRTTGCVDNQITGFATTGGAPVPEPTTMLLLGSLLSGLGIFGRKKLADTLKS
jgi:hypothetical protein